jgi:hypothetical protein
MIYVTLLASFYSTAKTISPRMRCGKIFGTIARLRTGDFTNP